MTIERSTGTPVTDGVVCYGMAGGGYEGVTPELDAVVLGAAKALAAAYGGAVVIRYNSDRESGGAWLRTGDGRDNEIGICADVVTESARAGWAARAERDRGTRWDDGFWQHQLDSCPAGQLTVRAHIVAEAVPDAAQLAGLRALDGWNDHGSGYHHGQADSVEDALARCQRFAPEPRIAVSS